MPAFTALKAYYWRIEMGNGRKLMWYFKQLLPLKYYSEYTSNGTKYTCKWRMWMGRCFGVDERKVCHQ